MRTKRLPLFPVGAVADAAIERLSQECQVAYGFLEPISSNDLAADRVILSLRRGRRRKLILARHDAGRQRRVLEPLLREHVFNRLSIGQIGCLVKLGALGLLELLENRPNSDGLQQDV